MDQHSKGNEPQPRETIGVDLGDKVSRYVILNEEGMAVEEGSFRNRVESITKTATLPCPGSGPPPASAAACSRLATAISLRRVAVFSRCRTA
jgi:hypothetical protein